MLQRSVHSLASLGNLQTDHFLGLCLSSWRKSLPAVSSQKEFLIGTCCRPWIFSAPSLTKLHGKFLSHRLPHRLWTCLNSWHPQHAGAGSTAFMGCPTNTSSCTECLSIVSCGLRLPAPRCLFILLITLMISRNIPISSSAISWPRQGAQTFTKAVLSTWWSSMPFSAALLVSLHPFWDGETEIVNAAQERGAIGVYGSMMMLTFPCFTPS